MKQNLCILKRILIIIFILSLLGLTGCSFFVWGIDAPDMAEGNRLSVCFLDVGQADAAVLRSGGQVMLIDGGNAADSSLIVSYLKKQHISVIDHLVCTHADEDHCGGLSGALSVCTVKNVYAPMTEGDSKAYRNFQNKVKKQGLSVTYPKHGTSFPFGACTVKVLGPIREKGESKNNTSIVLKVICGKRSFLFTGDAETESEHAMLDEGYDLSADVLKVSHHGSSGASSYVFLRAVMPEYAVISVGKNSYGHPTEAVLSRLRDAGTKVYRTDLQGNILAECDGETIRITPSKNPNADTLKPAK